MRIRSVAAGLALLLIACDQRSPVAPRPQPSAPTTPINPQTTGRVVDGSGAPVAGADIFFWPATGQTLVSNEAGLFPLPAAYFDTVSASKAGYEPATAIADTSIELTLHAIIRISVGQSLQLTIRAGDSLGGFGSRYRVRTIRLVPNDTVTAQIEVVAHDPGPVDFWIQDNCGDLCPHWVGLTRLPFQGGREYQMFLAMPSNTGVNRTFTVRTSVVGS